MITKQVRKNKKIPKNIKTLCKKYSIRLTIKRGPKRIKKSLSVLLKEIKKKMKGTKGTHFGKRRRRRFGEGEQPLPEGEQPLQEGTKKGIFKRAATSIKNKAIAAGGAMKRNPIKTTLAGLAIVGAVTVTAASGGLLGPEAALMAGKAIKTAAAAGSTISGKLGQMGDKVIKKASQAAEQLSIEKVQEATQIVQDVNEKVVQPLQNKIAQNDNKALAEVAQHAEQELAKAAEGTQFGKRRKRKSRFGDCGCDKKYPQFGNYNYK
jgi:hypothetical protein